MLRESYILFKQFLPKEIDLQGHRAHQAINLQSITKQLQNQPKNNSHYDFKQTTQPNQQVPFAKQVEEQYYSSNKVLKLKTQGNLNSIISAKITQNSSRSDREFMDDNVWKNLSLNKTKKFQDLTKDMPRKVKKPHMAIIFKTNKQMLEQSRQNEIDFVKRNLLALRKIVRSQSEQRHNLQMIRLDLIHAKKPQIKSKVHKQQLHQQFLRKQQKNDLKLKMLSKLVRNNHSSEKLIIKEIKKVNPHKYPNFNDVAVDLKTSKIIFQRKNSLKKEIIDKIRKERATKYEPSQKQTLQDIKNLSSYLAQGDQRAPNRSFSFHIKRRFKTEQRQKVQADNQISNQAQKFKKKKVQWDDFVGQAIQPW